MVTREADVGVGVDGVETAAACFRVLTPDDIFSLSSSVAGSIDATYWCRVVVPAVEIGEEPTPVKLIERPMPKSKRRLDEEGYLYLSEGAVLGGVECVQKKDRK